MARRRDGEGRERQVERLLAAQQHRVLEGLDGEARHGIEAAVGHLAGVVGAYVHGDREVPRQRRHGAEMVEVPVGEKDRRRAETELAEGVDHDRRLVAGVDDEAGVGAYHHEAVRLERAERDREDVERFGHGFLLGDGVRALILEDGVRPLTLPDGPSKRRPPLSAPRLRPRCGRRRTRCRWRGCWRGCCRAAARRPPRW